VNDASSGPHARHNGPDPGVSVLVAAWNEADRIGACLAALDSISWPRLQILVSAGGNDRTYEIACKFSSDRISIFPQQAGVGKQAALRELLTHATSEIIYLTDGDTLVPEATLQAVIQPIIQGETQVVTGNYRPYEDLVDSPLVFYQWSIDRAVERQRGRESEGITGANAAVTRAALDASGGFSSDVSTGTDYWLARQLRANEFDIRYVDAGVETEYADSPRLYTQRRSRWLRNTFLHGRYLGHREEVRNSLVTMGIGTVVIGGPILMAVNKGLVGAVWGGLVTILLKRRVRYASDLARERNSSLPSGYMIRLPYLILLDQLASALAAIDLVNRRRRHRW
jgi:cellulose synthase/poly-beta-1,6-N-acetylglucosamine synthase-like glycosyltransferase